MKKNKLLIMLALVLSFGSVQAQESDLTYLPLTVWIPGQIDGMPQVARRNLENKLNQVVLANGLTNSVQNARFIITANVMEITKDVTASVPPMQAYTLDVTFYIGDGLEGRAFSSYSTTIKGIGESKEKAYMAAVKNIRTKDPNYSTFIDQGKTKIVDYYNSQCDIIIKEAKNLAAMNQFDEALWKLSGIPTQATTCWDKTVTAMLDIYQQKIDYDCKIKVAEATAIWNANQSWEGAQAAGAILSSIDPNAACLKDAEKLSASISKRIKEVDNREWNIIYEQEVGLEKSKIDAIRQIGVAYGNNQPQNVNYKALW